MLFLRLTPTLPHTFINVASPMVNVPYHIFFLGTFIGLIPAAFVTVRVWSYLIFLFLFHLPKFSKGLEFGKSFSSVWLLGSPRKTWFVKFFWTPNHGILKCKKAFTYVFTDKKGLIVSSSQNKGNSRQVNQFLIFVLCRLV